ncbi:MAG: hypothetical protein JRH07_19810 [Deltaproteobacteria bacterium]|nr:hypothetical protein [Deltaproteobacteria bacterium]
MQAMVTLTPEESKRLIAKSIAHMEPVRKAKEEGLIGFSLCTSAGYVIEELLGRGAVSLSGYCCGFIYSGGSCVVPPDRRERLLLLERGEKRWLDFPEENLKAFIDRMDQDDIIIKSGNLIDPEGNVGVLVASPDGGEAGDYLPHILAKGIQLIVPMTLNKTIPVPLTEIIPHMGISRFRPDMVHGMSCGMMPLPGRVIREVEAFGDLFGVRALPVAMDGVGSGAGSVTLVLMGDDLAVERAFRLIDQIKGEPPLENMFSRCAGCEGSSGKVGAARCSTRAKRGASAVRRRRG